jgi:hypothetical protein
MTGKYAKEKFNTNPGMGILITCSISRKANNKANININLVELKTLIG